MRLAPVIILPIALFACGDDRLGASDTASPLPDTVDAVDGAETPDAADASETAAPDDTTAPNETSTGPDTEPSTCAEDCEALAGPCREGACAKGVCVFQPRSGPCEDGDLCTVGDTCVEGECVGSPKLCGVIGESCGVEGVCDPETGLCDYGDNARVLFVSAWDLWAQPLTAATLTLQTAGGTPVASGSALELLLCEPTELVLTASAPVHHGATARLVWAAGGLTVLATPSSDHAWVLRDTEDGLSLELGLAHAWFAATGPPARHGNRLELLMNGEEAWRSVHAAIQAAETLVTGASWWWTSELEIVRDRATDRNLTNAQRWANTIMGTLERRASIDRKIIVNQFIGQDGLFSGITVDDELTDKGAAPNDRFDYMGQANPTAGRFTVTLPAVDLASRLPAPGATLVAKQDAAPLLAPVSVDTTEVPLGLSLFDIPIASWHQKFWTIDQRVAFIGGMNAKTTDWDTIEQRVFEPLRMEFDASRSQRDAVANRTEEPDFGPRKDYMVRVDGPSAIDAVSVFHRRWEHLRQQGVQYSANASPFSLAAAPAPHREGLQAQVLATMPAPFSEYSILESMLRAVSQAQDYIFIEDQYFRAPILYDAIVHRMTAIPGLVLIVVTNEVSEWFDPGCWQTALAHDRFKRLFPGRFRVYRTMAYDVVRSDCTFCWDETDAYFVPLDLHSKLAIIDDRYLQTGSCNSNNRGLLYEGELAVAVHDADFVSRARHRIFEHLLGAAGSGAMLPSQMITRLDAAAAVNQAAYDKWDAAGMDLDLDGDPIPPGYTPRGFLYPLFIDEPDECLIEDVGPDVM